VGKSSSLSTTSGTPIWRFILRWGWPHKLELQEFSTWTVKSSTWLVWITLEVSGQLSRSVAKSEVREGGCQVCRDNTERHTQALEFLLVS
jgi:hypothetical protein